MSPCRQTGKENGDFFFRREKKSPTFFFFLEKYFFGRSSELAGRRLSRIQIMLDGNKNEGGASSDHIFSKNQLFIRNRKHNFFNDF